LVRLAADSGARLGELAALQFTDLDGRILHIRRAVSADVVTTPKVRSPPDPHPWDIDRPALACDRHGRPPPRRPFGRRTVAVHQRHRSPPSSDGRAIGHRFARPTTPAYPTLSEYAYVLPMTDGNVADAIDRHLDESLDGTGFGRPGFLCNDRDA